MPPRESPPQPVACPFCLSTNVAPVIGQSWWVRCDACHAQGPRAADRDDAVMRWNEAGPVAK